MAECRALIRAGRWRSPDVLCHRDADSTLVAVVDGQRIEHGTYCRMHAERSRRRYAGPVIIETRLRTAEKCPTCGGRGYRLLSLGILDGAHRAPCDDCGGTGSLTATADDKGARHG